jgi:hypothetical protein
VSEGLPAFVPSFTILRADTKGVAPGPEGDDLSGVIPELNVILGVVVASGERRRLGRRRLTRFPHVAP